MKRELIGFCGLDCEKCDARVATLRDDDALRAQTAELWCRLNHTDEILPEHINCMGCRTPGVKTYFCLNLCQIRICALEKGLETCADCPEKSLCGKLRMILDHADVKGELGL